MGDDIAVGRVRGHHLQHFDLAQGLEKLPEHIWKVLVITDERGDAGEDMVSSEQGPGAGVAKADVSRLVAGSENDLEGAVTTYRDDVSFVDSDIGRREERHPIRPWPGV